MSEVTTVSMGDGTRIAVSLDGPQAGAPIVLLHSIGCSGAMWADLAARLAPRRRVVRPDLRGHGRSDAPPDDYTLRRLALDIDEVLEALGIASADLCGLSLGGMVAQRLALDAPTRVRSLVLASTASRIGTAPAWSDRAALVRKAGMAAVAELALSRFFSVPFRAAKPTVVAEVREELLATSPEGYAAACAALRDADLTGEVGAIGRHTLVMAGRMDVSTPPEQVQRLAAAIHGARYVELDAGHLCNLEQPQAFAAAVQTFLEGGHG